MSLTAAVARVQEIQQLLSPLAPTASQPGRAFASTLASATTAATPTAPVAGAAAATGGVSGVPYADEINAAAGRHGLDPALLAGLIRAESGFDPNAGSPAGARGLAQLMPGTAASLGVDPLVPAQAIEGGARYLKQQLDRFGTPELALAAYNAGPGAVSRHGGVPPYAETQAYVLKVQDYAAQYRQAAAPLQAPATTGLDYSTL